MNSAVVDENVPRTANGHAEQANLKCRLACVQVLRGLVESGMVVIDAGGLIIDKYRKRLSHSGQPGVGDAFFRHVYDNQFNDQRVERAEIAADENRGFSEFPDDAPLSGFDRSDRVFVAVTLVSKHKPRVLNAVDSDWRDHKAALARHGVLVDELCPDCLRPASR